MKVEMSTGRAAIAVLAVLVASTACFAPNSREPEAQPAPTDVVPTRPSLPEDGLPTDEVLAIVKELLAKGDPSSASHAVELLERLTIRRSPDAFLILADCSSRGVGVPKDAQRSFRLLEESATALGDPRGMGLLGDCYWNARGVSVSYSRAFEWYSRGAALDDANSLAGVARSRVLGLGAPKNEAEALRCYGRAATLGHVPAMTRLAELLLNNENAGANSPSEGIGWLERATREGDAEAARMLGLARYWGRGTSVDRVAAVALFERASTAGDVVAKRCLAQCLINGDGCASEPARGASIFKDLASTRDVDAMCAYAGCLLDGTGTPVDTNGGVRLLERAAKAGSVEAMLRLASGYTDGRCGPPDEFVRAKWLRQAADLGSIEAQMSLATMRLEGRGGPRDRSEAIRLFEQAATQGSTLAMNYAAKLHFELSEIPADNAKAWKWVEAAATHGDADCMLVLAEAYRSGNEGLRKEPRTSARWYERAGEAGSLEAAFFAGLCHLEGFGVPQDQALALSWLERSAAGGHAEACREAGLLRQFGRREDRDLEAARRWYEKGDQLADSGCSLLLAELHLDRQVVGFDQAHALKLLRKAARAGNLEAALRLGDCYLDGIGTPQDKAQAFEWWKFAAVKGSAAAQYNIGVCYVQGWGTSQDLAEALGWLRNAASNGIVEAPEAVNWVVAELERRDAATRIARSEHEAERRQPVRSQSGVEAFFSGLGRGIESFGRFLWENRGVILAAGVAVVGFAGGSEAYASDSYEQYDPSMESHRKWAAEAARRDDREQERARRREEERRQYGEE